MKPLRKHVALAVDGGGIRGTMVAKALAVVEAELGKPCSELFHLSAGTSTGSIISAAIAARIPAQRMHELYVRLEARYSRSRGVPSGRWPSSSTPTSRSPSPCAIPWAS